MSAQKKNWRRGGLFPKTLAQCTDAVLKPALEKHHSAQAQLLTHWPKIVGKEIAQVSTPQHISTSKNKEHGSTLKLAVQMGFATEIQHKEPLILERIANFFGHSAIKRLQLQQTYFPEESSRPTKPKSTTTTPSLPEVQDPELRAALEGLAALIDQGRKL